MRSGSRPSRARVGTLSRKAISSSMLIAAGLYRQLPRGGRRFAPRMLARRVPGLAPGFMTMSLLVRLSQRCPFRRAIRSADQLVSACFGHQNGRIGGVPLDLLAQAVDVRFERVGGDARIVAPHFLQQDLARDRTLAGAIEVAQDRGLLFGEPDLVALGIHQEL